MSSIEKIAEIILTPGVLVFVFLMLNKRIDDLRGEIKDVREDLREMRGDIKRINSMPPGLQTRSGS